MKFDRKFFSVLLAVTMAMSMRLPVSAAQMEATYGEASYYDIAVEAYSRMLAFHDGVVGAANQNRQYGLITSTGEVRVDFQYDGIWYLADNMFSVEQRGRYGIIGSKGEEILPITHWGIEMIGSNYLRIDNDYFTADRSLTPVSRDEVYGYGDSEMDALAQRLGYDWVYSVGYMALNRYIAGKYSNSGYTYYLLDGDNSYNVLLSGDWLVVAYSDWTVDSIRILTHDGIYDGDGSLIYDAAAHGQKITEDGYYYNRNYGTVIVETINDSLKGVVDINGNQIIPCRYQRIGNESGAGFIGAVRDNGSGFVDSDLYRSDGTLFNTIANTYVSTEVYYRHMAFQTTEDGQNGMMDAGGNVLIPAEYSSIEKDSNNNLLVLRGDAYYGGTYGLYDQEGRVIFQDGYESISYLANNRYKLRDNGRYGVMNTSGRTVIPFNYVDMRVHTTSFIELYDGSDYKIVDLDNNAVVRESSQQITLFRPLYYDMDTDLNYVYDRFDSWPGELPFCIYTRDSGYATVYANPDAGTSSGELAHRASGINEDDMFAYQDDDTDLFGFGKLGASDVIASGYCGEINELYPEGENLTWRLTSDGTLTISGTGEMANAWTAGNGSLANDFLGAYYRGAVKKVVIESGATTIGASAFSSCVNLTDATIPNGVTAIKEEAFYRTGITNVIIPDSVTIIENNVFNQCENLLEITIPEGVTAIEYGTFYCCTNLKNATIPDSVTTIGEWAFEFCDKLTDVYYGGTKAQWNELTIADDNEPLLNATIHFLGEEEPEELPQGVKFVPYSHSFGEDVEVTSGRLPRGLNLDSMTGELTGAPLESGSFEFTVRKASGSVVYQMTVVNNTNSAVQRPNDYNIIENVGTQDPRDPNSFYIDEYREETFAIDGPYQEFYRLLIDGVEKIRDVDYTVREGSTIITIRTQTFRNVGEGTHTIAAEFRSTDSNGKTSVKQVAQNYTLNLRRPSDNTSSSDSSSSSTSTNYSITVPQIPNCTVKVSPSSASAGTRVTLTAKPYTGYVLSDLTVTGPNGKQVPLTQADDGKYTFRMPDGKVTISVQVEAEQPAPVPAGETPFIDMLETDWFYSAVVTAYQRGWMVGTSANTFAPQEKANRGMIVSVLHRIVGQPAVTDNTYFSDVPLNQYYTTAAVWAAENGIINGYGDGRFGPSDSLTREQIVMILYNYANKTGMDTTVRSELDQFTDLDQLSAGAQTAMSWAHAVGLVSGVGNGTLNPTGPATRAEMAAFLFRFVTLVENS